jgi:signal transduction histidine kinase
MVERAVQQRFAARVAHDLNNLLTPLLGHLDLLALRSPESAHMTGATDAAARTARFAARLAAFAGPEASPDVIDLVPLLVEAAPPGAHLHLPATLPVLCDTNTAALALAELLDNAQRAGGEVFCTAEIGDEVTITLRDTGIGMDEATLARVPEPFFSVWGKGAGRGLGLAIADAFARRSGGTLHVASTQGQGTTITLRLKRG